MHSQWDKNFPEEDLTARAVNGSQIRITHGTISLITEGWNIVPHEGGQCFCRQGEF